MSDSCLPVSYFLVSTIKTSGALPYAATSHPTSSNLTESSQIRCAQTRKIWTGTIGPTAATAISRLSWGPPSRTCRPPPACAAEGRAGLFCFGRRAQGRRWSSWWLRSNLPEFRRPQSFPGFRHTLLRPEKYPRPEKSRGQFIFINNYINISFKIRHLGIIWTSLNFKLSLSPEFLALPII